MASAGQSETKKKPLMLEYLIGLVRSFPWDVRDLRLIHVLNWWG